MAIIDGTDLSLDQNLRKAPMVEPPTDRGVGDTFGAALLRGVDSAQAGTYAFAKTLSDAVGVDVVSKWAERGIERNLQEMMENPPEIRSWDDVNGMADFGTYVLEALGEQVPQLAMQFVGAKGGSALAKAQLGKAMKRKLGEQAYKNYLNQAAIKGSAEAQARAKAARTGAIAGAMGLGTIQNVGETKMTLDDEGTADNSAQALLGGAIKGALDTIAFDRVMGLANRIGVPPDAVSDYLVKQAAKIGLGGAGTKLAVQVAKEGVTDAAVEGATEVAQTFVDQVLVHANKPNSDLFSSENIAELRESFIKGGILGGVVGGIETARLEFPDYMASRKRAQETAAQAISTLPAPSVDAQIDENPEVAVMPGPAVVPPAEEQEPQTPAVPPTTIREVIAQRQAAREVPTAVVNTDAQVLASQQADEALAVGLGTLPPRARQEMIDAFNSGHPQAEQAKARLREIGMKTLQAERAQMEADRVEAQRRTTVFKEAMVSPADAAAFPESAGPQQVAGVERPDPAVMPEPYTKTGLTPSEEVALAARYAGQRKAGMLQGAAARRGEDVQKVVGANIINAVTPEGEQVQLSLTDLTYAGMNALGADKTSTELSPTEFRVQGLEHALADMIANGWDVSSAFNERGRLRDDLVIRLDNVTRSTPRPDGDIRRATIERTNAQRPAPPEMFLPELPAGAQEDVRMDMALRIEEQQQRAVETLAAWAENPETDLAQAMGPLLRQRGEAPSPMLDVIAEKYRTGQYSSVEDMLDSPEVSELLARPEQMREALVEPDYNPYQTDADRTQAESDSASESQMSIMQDDTLQDPTGVFKSRIDAELGDPAERAKAVFPTTPRLDRAKVRISELQQQRKRLQAAKDELTSANRSAAGQPFNTIRERSDRIKALNAALENNRVAMNEAYAELDAASKEDARLATNRERPVAVRSRATASEAPIVPLVDAGTRAAPVDLTRDGESPTQRAQNRELRQRGEELGLSELVEQMIAPSQANTLRAPGYGSTPATKSIFDTAPEIKTDSKDLRVFSNSPGVTRADAEFVAGLVEHFGQRQVTNVRIDESETLQRDDVRLGKDGGTLVIIVPTLPGKLSAPARQALMAEAIGMGLFNRYLHADPDLIGPDRSQAYRAALEKAYLQETRRKKVDPVAFRKWFGVKTAAYVKSLMATSKYAGTTDKYGNPIDLRTTETKNIPEEVQNRPAGLADKVFRELSAKLANIWKAAEAKLKQYTPNYTVNKFLERVVRGDTASIWWDTRKVDPAKAETAPPATREPPREKLTLRDKQRGQQPPNEPPSPPAPPAGATGEPPGPPQAFANIVGNSMDPAAWRGVRELFSAGSQLRAAWEPLGLLIEQPTNTLVENETTGKEAYWTSVQTHRNMFTGSLNSILHKNFKGLDKGRIAVLESQAFKVLTMGTKDADFEAVRGGNIPAALQAFDPRAVRFAADLNALMQDVHAYQAKVNPKVRHTDGYFPRNYDLQAILSRKGEFDAILKKHDAEEVFDGMIEAFLRQQNNGEPLVPPAKHTRSRKITDQALVNDLVDAGFLNANPAVDMLKYLRNVVTRTEYDRLSPAIEAEFERFRGATLARVETGELTAEQAKKEIARVQGLLNSALGLTPVDKSSAWYRPLEELRALTSLNSLLFGGIAGITEGGAILLKTRGMVEAKQFARIIMGMFDKAKRAELTEFAEAMGVITSDMQAALGSMMFENTDSFDGPISRYVPKMLEITGNEYMARMWRVVAVTTGKQYLLNLADVISQGRDKNGDARHQLRELSATLTPEMIYAWRDAGFPSMAMVSREDTPANRQLFSATQQAVHAIGRYVGETVVNPTPADTPPLARNMFGAFLFQLKAFDMTHKKRAIMGVYREIERQHAKGGISYAAASAAMWAAPAVVVLLLLSAIQEELRQRIRSMGEEGMVAGHNGDIGRIAKVLTDRAGFTSIPFIGAALNPTDINTLAFEAGPTASKALQVGRDLDSGDPVAATLHMIPGLSQIPAAREAVYKGLEEVGVRG